MDLYVDERHAAMKRCEWTKYVFYGCEPAHSTAWAWRRRTEQTRGEGGGHARWSWHARPPESGKAAVRAAAQPKARATHPSRRFKRRLRVPAWRLRSSRLHVRPARTQKVSTLIRSAGEDATADVANVDTNPPESDKNPGLFSNA